MPLTLVPQGLYFLCPDSVEALTYEDSIEKLEVLFPPPNSFSSLPSPFTEICILTSWSAWCVQSWSKASFLYSQCLTQSNQILLNDTNFSLLITAALHMYSPYLKLSCTKCISYYSISLRFSKKWIEWGHTGDHISHESHLALRSHRGMP